MVAQKLEDALAAAHSGRLSWDRIGRAFGIRMRISSQDPEPPVAAKTDGSASSLSSDGYTAVGVLKPVIDLALSRGTRPVDLRGAYLRGADLSRAKLYTADLTDANLAEANLSNAIFLLAAMKNCP